MICRQFTKWLVSKETRIKRDSFIWNTIGAGFSACQSAVVLFFLSRIAGIEIVGIVTIGFALANLFMTIGQYGVTTYMVTDVKEKYRFADYFLPGSLRRPAPCLRRGCLLFIKESREVIQGKKR